MKTKVLVAIPCLYGAHHVKEAIESVINKENVSVLLIDNGAEQDVKDVLYGYFNDSHDRIYMPFVKNVYVTAAWNAAISYFLQQERFSHLILMNSDLLMQKDWDKVLFNRWAENPDDVCLPFISDDKNALYQDVNTNVVEGNIVHEGTPGVFITLNRKQAKLVSPLPLECRVWFSDNWIFGILRGLGYNTVVCENLIAHHYWSQTVSKVPNISEIIEEDKVAWRDIVEPRMIKLIETLKAK